ncbi:MAG: tail fiber protein, partial [Proteobacteria bacterium]|nr:tail fiber protein [Pseudomonadota bacterium]
FRTFLSLSVLTPGLVWTVFDARAQTCSQAPSCSELGFTKTVSQCAGKTVLKCPFNTAAVYCNDDTGCAALGFTDTITSCKGEYVKCPSDSTKGKCIDGPKVGDLKHSLYSSNHNGWLLCNGTQYSQSTYSKLYNVIRTSFCGVRSGGCSSGYFAVPDYRGFFLRGYSYPSSSTSTYQAYSGSWNYSTSSPQKEGLPNITGRAYGDNELSVMASGAFYDASGSNKSGDYGGKNDSAYRIFGFDASRSNKIYGSQSHVVPGNYGTYIFIYAGQ